MNLDIETSWLIVGLAMAFGLGWVASRLDGWQLKRESRDNPRALQRGLTLLFNDQPDAAVDAFIEALQHDPDTVDLHFALGNLFRRRGEFERAIRVHQHLLQRADLKTSDRDRAQLALAQDFTKAQLFDRAEAAYRSLEGTAHESQARLAVLSLQEQARDWLGAAKTAQALEAQGAGNFAVRMTHHLCEQARDADARGQSTQAEAALRGAMDAATLSPRPLVDGGRRHAKAGRHDLACDAWLRLSELHPSAVPLVALEWADSAHQAGRQAQTLGALHAVLAGLQPSSDVAQAVGSLLHEDVHQQAERLSRQLALAPNLSRAADVLRQVPPSHWSETTRNALTQAVTHAAEPDHRYRCAACGFYSVTHSWQCPGCRSWDSFPTTRVDAS
jgi:lipopolysaccharide assembly protein B